MKPTKTLMERWREVAVSRFGKALLDECDRHGGIDNYTSLLGIGKPAFGTWVRNIARPGYEAAAKMAEISPVLITHLEERGCLKNGAALPNRSFQRRQAPVPLQASAQTTEVAVRKHTQALTEAEQRAVKLRRAPLIAKAARKIDARKKARDRMHRDQVRKLEWANDNPCTHAGYLAIAEGIGNGSANVAVPTTFEMEET